LTSTRPERCSRSTISPSMPAPTVHGALKLLDDAGIEGEMVLREQRSGRVEVKQMWGRPQSVRDEFKRSRAQ